MELTGQKEFHRRKVQSKIVSCTNCQPYDEGEPVWINGDRWELTELLEDNKVPEEYWDSIVSHLICPGCGTDNFETYMDVGIKSQFDIALDKYIEQTLKKFKPLIIEFDTLLARTPLLAYSHKFGRRLFKELEKTEFPITNIEGVFYRAREAKNSEVLSKEMMMNPPVGKPHEGRYNHSGQSHLYISSNCNTAIEEVIGLDEDKIVWSLEINIGRVDKILDLSFDWTQTTPQTSPIYFSLCGPNFINQFERNHEHWKPDYFLTRYIMDCAKMLGYNGIKYNSTKASYIDNVVLFYPENCDIQVHDEPKLNLYRKKESPKYPLIDL